MEAPIKLSIVTITYRDPEGLKSTINSLHPLLTATWKWEHIVVDASPELSRLIYDTLPPNWPLRLIERPAKGIYNAMNEGIKVSEGEYLWFLNGKDLLADGKVLHDLLVQFDANDRLDIICSAVDRVREGKYQFRWLPGKTFFQSLLGGCGPCHQGMLYRRTVFKKIGLYREDYKMSSDYDHHLRCWSKGLNVVMSNLRSANFDVSGVSATGYNIEFMEIKKIHAEHSKNWSLVVRLLQTFARVRHRTSVRTLKYLQKAPFSGLLRKLWVTWKQRNDSAYEKI